MEISILEKKITPLINDLENCINNNLYYAALCLSLTLPDICSSVEFPDIRGKKKYIDWVDKYFMSIHTEYEDMMTSKDLYALRCSYLHNGIDDLDGQYARNIVNRFQFVYSVHENIFHCNLSSKIIENDRYNILNLDIKQFSLEMIEAVRSFVILNNESDNIKFNSNKLIELLNDKNGFTF